MRRPLYTALALSAVLLPACQQASGPAPATSAGKTYGKYTVLGPKYDNVDSNKAKDNAADMLTQLQGEPQVALVGLWAYNPPAILAAVKAADKVGKVQIVGFDEDENTLLGIKDGAIHGTVVQQPFEFGYQSVKVMAALAKDPNAPLPAGATNGVLHVPHLIIKKNNVEEFHKKLNELKKFKASEESSGGQRVKVGFVSNNVAEFWTIAEAGTRKAAEELGVEVLFRRPKNASANDQKEIIEDLLTQGVKAIAISVIDPVNQHDYLNSVADRVPLITQDNDAPKTKRKCYIGTDNVEAGRDAGRMVKEALPDGGTVGVFVGQPDPINAKERVQGVLEALAEDKK